MSDLKRIRDCLADLAENPRSAPDGDWLRKFIEMEPPSEPTRRGEPAEFVYFDEPPWPVQNVLYRTSGRDVASEVE